MNLKYPFLLVSFGLLVMMALANWQAGRIELWHQNYLDVLQQLGEQRKDTARENAAFVLAVECSQSHGTLDRRSVNGAELFVCNASGSAKGE